MKQIYRLVILIIIISIFFTFANSAQSSVKDTLTITNKTTIKTLVVIYSSTGNTRAVANEIIQRFNADTVIIKTKEYDGFFGGLGASSDAWNEVKITDIQPEIVDMSQYNLIFLGSPIWWYRPAVPLWTFVEKNNFENKKVVLFNTFNSRFEQPYIDEFKKLVEEKGGNFIDHIYVRRGRWYSQLDREELLLEFRKLLDARTEKWQGMID